MVKRPNRNPPDIEKANHMERCWLSQGDRCPRTSMIKRKATSDSEDVEKLEFYHIPGGNVRRYKQCGKHFGSFLRS